MLSDIIFQIHIHVQSILTGVTGFSVVGGSDGKGVGSTINEEQKVGEYQHTNNRITLDNCLGKTYLPLEEALG